MHFSANPLNVLINLKVTVNHLWWDVWKMKAVEYYIFSNHILVLIIHFVYITKENYLQHLSLIPVVVSLVDFSSILCQACLSLARVPIFVSVSKVLDEFLKCLPNSNIEFGLFLFTPWGTPQHGWFIRLVAKSPDSWMSYLHTAHRLSVSTMLEKQVERLFIWVKWLMGKINHNEMNTQNATTAIFTLWKDIRDTGEL